MTLQEAPEPPRVGLVLGGGGLLGGTWLVGALHALWEASGWDASTADHLVGTSAGSVVAAMLACGFDAPSLMAHQLGDEVDGLEPVDALARGVLTRAGGIARPVLGSPGLAVRSSLRPWRFTSTVRAAAWLGQGFLSTDQIGRAVRAIAPAGWPHPRLWIPAVDYATGRRVVFGRDAVPNLHLAVEASCAIPGVYRPVTVNGRQFIDGGVWSPSNVDVLADAGLDVVVVVNPMSSLNPGLPAGVLERIHRRLRTVSTRQLVVEASRVRQRGTQVMILQPDAEDVSAMGVNLMNRRRRTRVLRTVERTMQQRLRDPDVADTVERLRLASGKPTQRRAVAEPG